MATFVRKKIAKISSFEYNALQGIPDDFSRASVFEGICG